MNPKIQKRLRYIQRTRKRRENKLGRSSCVTPTSEGTGLKALWDNSPLKTHKCFVKCFLAHVAGGGGDTRKPHSIQIPMRSTTGKTDCRSQNQSAESGPQSSGPTVRVHQRSPSQRRTYKRRTYWVWQSLGTVWAENGNLRLEAKQTVL